MKQSYPLGMAALAVFCLCAPAFAETGVTGDAIIFGQVAALDGPAGSLGREMRDGILAGFEEANRSGGVRGRKLKLISEDDGYDPARTIEATKKFVNGGKIFALIGSVGTPTSAAAEPIASEAGIPFITPLSGADFLREPFNPNVVNIRASYSQETETMVERLTKDRGVSRIAILYQDDAFGRAGLTGVKSALAKRAVKLVGEGTFERNTVAVKSALLAIERSQPEAVILIAPYRPSAEFIKLSRKLKFNALFLALSFAGGNPLAQELGAAGAGVIATQVVPLSENGALPVVARYRAALKSVQPGAKLGFVSLEGYLAARLTIAALEKEEGEPNRTAFLKTIFSNQFDLGGVKLSFGPANNQGSSEVFLTVLRKDGTFEAVRNLGSGPSGSPKKAGW